MYAITAARNGCAGWITCENWMDHWPRCIASSLRAIGSLAAMRSKSSADFCTANFTPKQAKVLPGHCETRDSRDANTSACALHGEAATMFCRSQRRRREGAEQARQKFQE